MFHHQDFSSREQTLQKGGQHQHGQDDGRGGGGVAKGKVAVTGFDRGVRWVGYAFIFAFYVTTAHRTFQGVRFTHGVTGGSAAEGEKRGVVTLLLRPAKKRGGCVEDS